MSTLLNFARDVQGYNAYAPATSTNKYSATLVTATSSNITVPSNFQNWIAVFCIQPGASIWVDLTGTTATPPAGATFSSNTAELNPAQRRVGAGDTISCYNSSTTSQDVGILLYAIT
jgi:hypothetical protein